MRRDVCILAAAIAAVAAIAANGSVLAHPTATSPYTFSRDILPILEARCGRCHSDESPAQEPLLNYQSARRSIWPMRQVLLRGHMPPWFAEGAFKAPAPMTARELNILMTWTAGGAPEGPTAPRRPAAMPSWALGPPDVIVPMPSAFAFAGNQDDRVHEVQLPSAKIGGRMIRAVDLLPGTPAIVRSAEIIARSGTEEQVLGVWQPGESPALLEANAAFRVPANASLVLRTRYRRHYGDPAEDLSRVGIYFAKGATSTVRTLEFSPDGSRPEIRPLQRRVRAVAIRPISGPPGTQVRLTVIAPDGSRKELARLEIQNHWGRRYVFVTPVILAAGNRIEASVIPSDGPLWTSFSGELTGPEGPIRLALEFVN
jgi:hypothetical protein